MWTTDTEEKARAIIQDFTSRGLKLATAESCTGGLIAGALTGIAGSSSVVDRGFVTYSNEAKVEMLGVNPQRLPHMAPSRVKRRWRWRAARFCAQPPISP